jgi:hypothetical protein
MIFRRRKPPTGLRKDKRRKESGHEDPATILWKNLVTSLGTGLIFQNGKSSKNIGTYADLCIGGFQFFMVCVQVMVFIRFLLRRPREFETEELKAKD